jgi:outer membrane receptor protein involved in Fe transport
VTGTRQGNLSPGRSFLIPQYRLYSGGVYGLEELALSRLTLTAGARYDYRWQHAFQFGSPVIVSPDDRRTYVGPSGSLGASYKLSETWSLAATGTEAWRPPADAMLRGVEATGELTLVSWRGDICGVGRTGRTGRRCLPSPWRSGGAGSRDHSWVSLDVASSRPGGIE